MKIVLKQGAQSAHLCAKCAQPIEEVLKITAAPTVVEEVSTSPEAMTDQENEVSDALETDTDISTAIEAALSLVQEISQNTAALELIVDPEAQPATVAKPVPELEEKAIEETVEVIIPESVPEQVSQEPAAPKETTESIPETVKEVPENTLTSEPVASIPKPKEEASPAVKTEVNVEFAKQTEEPQPSPQKSEPEVKKEPEVVKETEVQKEPEEQKQQEVQKESEVQKEPEAPKPMQNGHVEPVPETIEKVSKSENLTQIAADQSLPTQNEPQIKSETDVEEKQKEIVGTEVRFEKSPSKSNVLIFD